MRKWHNLIIILIIMSLFGCRTMDGQGSAAGAGTYPLKSTPAAEDTVLLTVVDATKAGGFDIRRTPVANMPVSTPVSTALALKQNASSAITESDVQDIVDDAVAGIPGSTITPDTITPTKAAIAVTADTIAGSGITQSPTYRLATDTEKSTWNAKVDPGDLASATVAHSSTSDYATSAASVDPVKTSGVPGMMSVFEADGTSTLKTGFIGPLNSTINCVYQFANGIPSPGDTFVMGTPATGQTLPDGTTGTIIPLTHAAGGSSANDTAFGISWDGDTTTPASKNALYDKIETLSAGAAPTIQSADPTSASSVGFYGATTSGDFFYKSSSGLFNLTTGTYTLDPTPPTITGLTLAENGTTLTMTASEAITAGSGFSVADLECVGPVSGTVAVASVTFGDGTPTWVMELTSPMLKESEEGSVVFNWAGTANGIEDGDGTDLAAITSMTVTNNSTQTSGLVVEDWEGTGLGTWTAYNEESACTINPDYTTSPINGIQSLYISSPNYQQGQVITSVTPIGNITLSFNYTPITLPTLHAEFITLYNGSTVLCTTNQRTDGNFAIYDGTADGYPNLPAIAGTTYSVFLERTKGSGANGVLSLYVAAGKDQPKPASPIGTITTGTSTLDITSIRIGTAFGGVIKIDDILVTEN